jgi:Ser/Thr protein kinase RdoA (MazF antagonist)
MEKRIKERFNDHILQQAMKYYRISDRQIRLLDGFESFIYEFERAGKTFILRLAHSLRRSENLIRGEVNWINYLYDGGASVARAILSEKGNLVESIPDVMGGQFLATAFIKANGEFLQKEMWSGDFFEKYGRLIGRMHALAKNYIPSDPTWKRPHWDDPDMVDIEGWLPESELNAIKKYQELKSHLDALPKTRDSYGLIHQDAHAGNFFVDELGEITLFDFDDCAYSWYINDIAIVLFYIVLGVEDQDTFTREFMTNFLRGYNRENLLAPFWLNEIPSFLKLREIDLYAVIHRSFDVDKLEHPWVAMYMHGRKDKIENNIPFIEFDFSSLL